jgi:hypothetical protein
MRRPSGTAREKGVLQGALDEGAVAPPRRAAEELVPETHEVGVWCSLGEVGAPG